VDSSYNYWIILFDFQPNKISRLINIKLKICIRITNAEPRLNIKKIKKMDFLPQFSISIHNAFWFSLLFWISNLIVLTIFPTHYKNRVLTRPKFSVNSQKLIGTFNFFLFQALLIVVLFMPLQFNTSYFGFGLTLFIIAFVTYIISLVNYATSNPKKPVTKGVYKLSRNPQQITTIFMWIGIGLMTNCILIIAICVVQLFTVYPTFKAQEQFCIDKYGNDYSEYMKKAPRYFLFI